MTTHPHKSLRQEPVIWEYGQYRITQADDRNLKIFQFKQPVEDWDTRARGRGKGKLRPKATWVRLSYHSSLFLALMDLIDKVACDPVTVDELALSNALCITNRIALFEEAVLDNLKEMVGLCVRQGGAVL